MLYSPHPKQSDVHNSPSRFKILNWGRRTGKSMFALEYTLYEALRKQGRYWIVLPTYKQAKDIYWKQYIKTLIPQELIKDVNNVDLTVTLNYIDDEKNGIKHDTKLPNSTIELKGSDNANTLRGTEVNGLVFDEYAYHEPEHWKLVFEPMLLTTQGWAMFISTPNGFNHFYDLYMYAQGYDKTETGGFTQKFTKGRPSWFYSHATPYDNPVISKTEIDRIRSENTPDEFAQEYMAEFKKMEGLVYKSFDRAIHVVTPEKVPQTGTHIVGIDFGYQNPAAILYILIDYDQNWWVYDEIYERKRTINQLALIIKEKSIGKNILSYIGDSQASEHIANLNQQNIPCVPVTKRKDYISAGINILQEKLIPREQLHGPPKPKLFISSTCVNLIEEFEKYRYPRGKNTNRNEKEEPMKKDDHALDALRYAALYYQFDINKTYDFPQEDLFDGGFYR